MFRPTPISTLFPYTTLFRSIFEHLSRSERARREHRLSQFSRRAAGAERDEHGLSACSGSGGARSEEHTSELQSRPHLVCRLLLAKKKLTGHQAHVADAACLV